MNRTGLADAISRSLPEVAFRQRDRLTIPVTRQPGFFYLSYLRHRCNHGLLYDSEFFFVSALRGSHTGG